ncbi:MAG: N-acetyltransferase [Oscillospiraceae bacterium]|nr:N-acetyltransferase [Oscillospiraceae bacterium]
MIRLAVEADLPRLGEVFDDARAFMRANGNDVQWTDGYPRQQVLLEDIRAGQLYVIEEAGRVCACFMLAAGPDPTYEVIFDGSWGADKPYGVIHRVASDGSCRGVVAQVVAFAQQYFDYLRIDTHEKNIPMQQAVKRLGFTCRGGIYTHDGTPRIAFDRV